MGDRAGSSPVTRTRKRASKRMPSFWCGYQATWNLLTRSVIAATDEAKRRPSPRRGVQVLLPAPKRRESEQDSLLFGRSPSARNDPLRSNWQEGKPIPSCTTPLKSIPGSDLDCPGASERGYPKGCPLSGGPPPAGISLTQRQSVPKIQTQLDSSEKSVIV